jgi:5-methylcytosine-specific restriction endonuclease McrA
MGKRDNARKRRAALAALGRQKGRCFYCKEPLAAELATADHRTPRRLGGGDCRENIAAACMDCNHAKRDLAEGYFFSLIKGREAPKRHKRVISIWLARGIYRECKRNFNLGAQ